MTSSPPVSSHGEAVSSDSIAATVPNGANSAKVRKPALAAGLRSRSRPINRPMKAGDEARQIFELSTVQEVDGHGGGLLG